MTKNVHHDFRYHAEIRYETEKGFAFTNAMGNNFYDFIKDCRSRIDYVKDRQPQLVEALRDPNGENINITYKVITILKMEDNNG
jgi:hypothetical protein